MKKPFRYKRLALYLSLITVGVSSSSFAFLSVQQAKSNPAAVAAIQQLDQINAVLEVSRAQTARTPADIGTARLTSLTEQLAAEQAVKTTDTIIQNIEDTTLGKGVTPTMACLVVKEKQEHAIKQEISSQVRTAIAQSNASLHFSNNGDRKALRAKHHYSKYCDVTEAKQGMCLMSGNIKGGMDTDYNTIHSNLTLDEEQIDAGYAFMHNIIDPAKSDYSFCDNLDCEKLSKTENQYHAMGSMVQNAFLNQMQDSIAYDTKINVAQSIVVDQLGALSETWDGRLATWGDSARVGGGGTVVVTDINLGDIKPQKFAGFDRDMDLFIHEAAAKFNIDEKTLRGFIKMEGGWTGAMSPTGALGPGQFTQGTWDYLAKTAEGRAIGMKPIHNCYQKSCDPRRDRRINTLATALLMVRNGKDLERKGIPPTPENLYMAHNMGPGFVKAIYGKGKFSHDTRRNINVNGGRGMTPQQFINFQKRRFLQHYADANQPSVYKGR